MIQTAIRACHLVEIKREFYFKNKKANNHLLKRNRNVKKFGISKKEASKYDMKNFLDSFFNSGSAFNSFVNNGSEKL